MKSIHALILRRMRTPLLVLIGAYAISILGLVLIPGVDENGNVWHVSFFHAFYFVSYVASTIGFGEIPHEFTNLQRMWTIATIYLCVVAWFYSLGSILTLVQDQAFRQALTRSKFKKQVVRLSDPFFLVCGFGDTGSLLTRALISRGFHAVVIDINAQRIAELELANHEQFVPALCADANFPDVLIDAGLKHKLCKGVMALTNDDHTNLQIAIATKLLHPDIKAICRAHTADIEANMASFGTDHIVNPFDTFAHHLATVLRNPIQYAIYQWLANPPNTRLQPVLDPPKGVWIICGYGRLGQAANNLLRKEGFQTVVIEKDPTRAMSLDHFVEGRGTEAHTLHQAKVKDACGVIAATDDDADNLSIIMTAKELNPILFTVARQSLNANEPIYHAAKINMIMDPAQIIVSKIMSLITAPLLPRLLRKLEMMTFPEVKRLADRVQEISRGRSPEIWTLRVTQSEVPGLWERTHHEKDATLTHITSHADNRDKHLDALALFLVRGDSEILLPNMGTVIEEHDRILFCGTLDAANQMRTNAIHASSLHYIVTGIEKPTGWLWKKLFTEKPSAELK